MSRLKRWILNVFCKDELQKIHDQCSSKALQIVLQSKRKRQENEIVHQILSDERNSIIREWKNRSGEHFFIVKKTVDNKVLFKIYSRYVRTINRHQQNIEDANIKERRTNRLKQWIMDVLCKDELTEINEQYAYILERAKLKEKIKNQENEIVHQILSEEHHSIVGEADNKKDEHVFIVQWTVGEIIWFKLYGRRYRAICSHPRIMATYCPPDELMAKYCPDDGHPRIWIDDILVEDDDIGNGSILMPYFLRYCKQHTDADFISGKLSSKDIDHFDRSEHFYKKHGFEVFLNENRTKGSIKYQLREEL